MEIPSTSDDARAFIVLGAYRYDENGRATAVSNFLSIDDNTRFFLRTGEIEIEYIENDWCIADEDIINSVYINNIKSIKELEYELSKLLDDFSGLDVAWKCDCPI